MRMQPMGLLSILFKATASENNQITGLFPSEGEKKRGGGKLINNMKFLAFSDKSYEKKHSLL